MEMENNFPQLFLTCSIVSDLFIFILLTNPTSKKSLKNEPQNNILNTTNLISSYFLTTLDTKRKEALIQNALRIKIQ